MGRAGGREDALRDVFAGAEAGYGVGADELDMAAELAGGERGCFDGAGEVFANAPKVLTGQGAQFAGGKLMAEAEFEISESDLAVAKVQEIK